MVTPFADLLDFREKAGMQTRTLDEAPDNASGAWEGKPPMANASKTRTGGSPASGTEGVQTALWLEPETIPSEAPDLQENPADALSAHDLGEGEPVQDDNITFRNEKQGLVDVGPAVVSEPARGVPDEDDASAVQAAEPAAEAEEPSSEGESMSVGGPMREEGPAEASDAGVAGGLLQELADEGDPFGGESGGDASGDEESGKEQESEAETAAPEQEGQSPEDAFGSMEEPGQDAEAAFGGMDAGTSAEDAFGGAEGAGQGLEESFSGMDGGQNAEDASADAGQSPEDAFSDMAGGTQDADGSSSGGQSLEDTFGGMDAGENSGASSGESNGAGQNLEDAFSGMDNPQEPSDAFNGAGEAGLSPEAAFGGMDEPAQPAAGAVEGGFEAAADEAADEPAAVQMQEFAADASAGTGADVASDDRVQFLPGAYEEEGAASSFVGQSIPLDREQGAPAVDEACPVQEQEAVVPAPGDVKPDQIDGDDPFAGDIAASSAAVAGEEQQIGGDMKIPFFGKKRDDVPEAPEAPEAPAASAGWQNADGAQDAEPAWTVSEPAQDGGVQSSEFQDSAGQGGYAPDPQAEAAEGFTEQNMPGQDADGQYAQTPSANDAGLGLVQEDGSADPAAPGRKGGKKKLLMFAGGGVLLLLCICAGILMLGGSSESSGQLEPVKRERPVRPEKAKPAESMRSGADAERGRVLRPGDPAMTRPAEGSPAAVSRDAWRKQSARQNSKDKAGGSASSEAAPAVVLPEPHGGAESASAQPAAKPAPVQSQPSEGRGTAGLPESDRAKLDGITGRLDRCIVLLEEMKSSGGQASQAELEGLRQSQKELQGRLQAAEGRAASLEAENARLKKGGNKESRAESRKGTSEREGSGKGSGALAGWRILGLSSSLAVLEGPDGRIWRAGKGGRAGSLTVQKVDIASGTVVTDKGVLKYGKD